MPSMMLAENIAVGFAGKAVLENLTIKVEKGQILTILGPNGSGKSTLLKALARNLKPDSGNVYLDGANLAELNAKVIARKMAVLPQSPEAPKDLTVRDLVEYGRYPHQNWWQSKSPEDDACVDWALGETGLTAMAGRIVSTLSGGERQRVWIAMALAQKPEVLLLDEPTTYLDICHQLEIMELLADFNRAHNITVAMVLHDINQAAKYSDCVAVVYQGKIFAIGTPAEVITVHTLRQVFGVESIVTLDNTGRPVVMITGLTKKEAINMIQIEGLVKKFGERTAVDNLSLNIARGEVFGLLGPNGAGKTTTIRVLTMLTLASAGKIVIDGCDISKDKQAIKAVIGVVPQHFNLDIDLTAWENLELHGRLHHMPEGERRQRITELLEYVELSDRANDMVQKFSGGMKRRLMIARALLHRPKVLFLDEPTVGLDPQVRRRLWELIRRLKGEGLTVLLTTHYIEEAESLCQRVAILEKGKLIALDTPSTLCQRLGAYVVEWDDAEGQQTKFFADRNAAAEFTNTLTTTTTLRQTNLEDAFVELTGRKVVG